MPSLLDALSDSENTIDLQDENLITPIHEFLEINPEKRLITIPESEQLFGVYGENKVEIKYFKCPRIILNDIDLYECYIFINYISASGKIGYIQADTVVLDETEDYIIFTWELTRNVFDENIDTDIYFSISAKQYLEDKEPVFFTRKAKGNLYETVYAEEQITEQYADIILQLLAEMDGVKQIATPEAMQEYVSIWLSENPDKLGGQPIPVKSASEMLNTNTIYLYMGVGETVNEVVYEKGYIYYYSEEEQSWVKGSLYGGEGSSFSGSASDVTYDDTETKLGATNVQDAVGKLSQTVNALEEDMENVGSPTDEQVSNAVNDYLDKNPVTGGTSSVVNTDYKWIKSGQMRTPVRDFQGWAHCVQYDKELGKAVGIVISGNGSHSNVAPFYRVTIENNGYMSPYEEITFNYPESDTTEVGYIGSFLILEDGTYWVCDYRQRIFTSSDKGYTWDFVTQLTLNGRNTYNNDFLFGVTVLDNGRFVGGNGGNTASETYYSDNGVDWTTVVMDASQLGQQTYPEGNYKPFEPFFIDCGNGKVIQYARASMNAFNTFAEGNWTKQEGAVYSLSEDYGTTWTPWQWSKSIVDMTANNGKVVVIDDVVHFVYGSRYLGYVDEYGNTPFFALRYVYTTLEKVLNDEWEESIVIDVGHWDEATATLKADCGYPSLWKDENNNLYAVYYDSDESGSAYGANWRLLFGNPYVQKKAVENGGNGSKNVAYSQEVVDLLIRTAKSEMLQKINEIYILIGQMPPDSGENDGSMYITNGLVDFWQPQIEENWSAGASYYTLNGMYKKANVISVTRISQNYANPTITPSDRGLYAGNAFVMQEKYSTYCDSEFTFEGVFYTPDNSDGFMKVHSVINTYSTTYLANNTQAGAKWNEVNVGTPYGANYPLTNKISHITITAKDGEIKFYVNAQLITTITDESCLAILDGYIGSNGFAVEIADIRLYSRVLTEDEIKNNYQYEQQTFTFGAVS